MEPDVICPKDCLFRDCLQAWLVDNEGARFNNKFKCLSIPNTDAERATLIRAILILTN